MTPDLDNNDFRSVFDDMRTHSMKLPTEHVHIGIADAETVVRRCFEYVLALNKAPFLWRPEYEQVAHWLSDNQGRGLLLFGDCGLGKSVLARFVIPAILLKYTRKVVNCYDVQEMNSKLDEVLSKNIITLDDIGTEDISNSYGNKRLAFAEIMDAAEKYGRLVIISTNLRERELIEKYGKRVFERIIATTKQIKFEGKSLRR